MANRKNPLQEAVEVAFKNGVENDRPFFESRNIVEVAMDMAMYDADIEKLLESGAHTQDELVSYVKEARQKYTNPKS